MYDKEVLEEVENVMHKEDTEDEEMVKQVGRKAVIVIIICPVRLGTTRRFWDEVGDVL